ncbi:hypothetical protein SULYE_0667 [Sulfurihydrogenibium yellowstonense SS-5]|uniref:Uncharacterized protein n=1 Tax=Sulfurihydrogenibium yellowstonense SS-5 TaxID=432331 RepID=C4FJC5_9AQUI|nr:hypothetical protein SULYE_0667 [Sulfurihydrogenibium yellowstonense SS-5]
MYFYKLILDLYILKTIVLEDNIKRRLNYKHQGKGGLFVIIEFN